MPTESASRERRQSPAGLGPGDVQGQAEGGGTRGDGGPSPWPGGAGSSSQILAAPAGQALALGRVARHSSAGVAVPSRARRVGGPAWSSRPGRRDGVEEKSEDTTQTSR